MGYGTSLKNLENKDMFGPDENYDYSFVLARSYTTKGPDHVWSSIVTADGSIDVNISPVGVVEPAALTVINFPGHVLPRVERAMAGTNVLQPYYTSANAPPPKQLRIHVFTPAFRSYNNWEQEHQTYTHGIEVYDTYDNLRVTPAMKYLLTRDILTATVSEIKSWILNNEEYIATVVWENNEATTNPSGSTTFFSFTFKGKQWPYARGISNDPNSYNKLTGVAIINRPAFKVSMTRYQFSQKHNMGKQDYIIDTQVYQDMQGIIGISFSAYVNTGGNNLTVPLNSNTNPFMAIIVDTEAYN